MKFQMILILQPLNIEPLLLKIYPPPTKKLDILAELFEVLKTFRLSHKEKNFPPNFFDQNQITRFQIIIINTTCIFPLSNLQKIPIL